MLSCGEPQAGTQLRVIDGGVGTNVDRRDPGDIDALESYPSQRGGSEVWVLYVKNRTDETIPGADLYAHAMCLELK